MTQKVAMRLSDFITSRMEVILGAWEEFAKTITPPAFTMDSKALRNHASFMLGAIAADIGRPQTELEQSLKSRGLAPRGPGDTAAETHAMARLASGYSIEQLVSEYRALRSSVLHLWGEVTLGLPTDMSDVTRFNEGIDQALAESVARFAMITKEAAENERQRLNAVLEAAPVGISVAEAGGKVILCNPEYKRIWGEPPTPESTNEYGAWQGWWADGSDKDGQPLQSHEWALVRALSGQDALNDRVDIQPFHDAGERRAIVLNAKPVRDSNQNIVGAVVAQMDISHQVKAKEALRESEAKFRTIAEAMPQMVWSTLPDGEPDYYNRRWYEFTGVRECSTAAKMWDGILHPDDRDRVQAQWQHSLATGETYEVQYRLLHHSSEYRWALARALPVRDASGKISRWMGTCTDIHAQKEAEDELREASRRKDEFLAMLAHELRNPLAPINTAAELIKLVANDERRLHQASEIISRQVSYMTDLVDDLLDVSRVTRGLTDLQKETLNLQAVVYSAIEQAGPLLEARNHELRLRIGPTPAFVSGDKTRLVQIIANILNNAAKYTPQGGQISLVLEAKPPTATIRISDNGSGIAPSLLPHIFDLFTQGERTPDRAQGGLGLGLSLVKSLTALHGGWVTASSEGLGKGSTFIIGLPLQAAGESPAGGDAAVTRPVQPSGPVRLMIVDDNTDAAESLASLLEAKGHQVVVVGNADRALAHASLGQMHAFILDIGLPDMDGYSLARRLRAKPETGNAVMIALSGYGQAHDRVLSKAAGFDYHLVKPTDTVELTAILNQLGSPQESS